MLYTFCAGQHKISKACANQQQTVRANGHLAENSTLPWHYLQSDPRDLLPKLAKTHQVITVELQAHGIHSILIAR
jgi:hypothetical protein